MSEAQKIMTAVAAVFVIGFVMVGLSKEEQPIEQVEAAAKIRNNVAMQTMASEKCPPKIKEATGEQVFFPSETESDKETYVTLKWVGENAKNGGFKNASCTLHASLGGISELIIDDKVVIKKKM
ncbi:MAG: hypothetical protein Q7U38_18280 [Methylobacter sp.]|nr:hypothetical protein [Methylobacter sp.]MDP2098212.1 hypothetical protein [Methylobacter sp.]MDP2426709.1 hypothetical protein [Methylobacter sp.]MDP3054741.1 hypothetical protein [Methylobacter sp.]MDP3361793.1 hypothetical protein [Methylobacter sp.]